MQRIYLSGKKTKTGKIAKEILKEFCDFSFKGRLSKF